MVKTRKPTWAGIAAMFALGLALAILVLVMPGTQQADAAPERTIVQPKGPSCAVGWTKYRFRPNYGFGECYIPGGQEARLRADCPVFPDRYSNWKQGKGNRTFKTGSCPSVRRVIVEWRYA